MDETTPEITYTKTFHGSGNLHRDTLNVALASFTIERNRYSYNSAWALSGLVQEGSSQMMSSLGWSGRSLYLEGITAAGIPVLARSIRLGSIESLHFSAEVDDVQVGPSTPVHTPEKQIVTVFLTENGIARREFDIVSQYWTGEIKGEGKKAALPSWSSSLGKFELSMRFEWEKARIGTAKASAGIPRPALWLSLSNPTPNVAELISGLVEELALVVRLLSFLSRHHVDWCEILVHSIGRSIPFSRTTLWKRSWSSQRPDYLHPLVNKHLLPETFIDTMLTRFGGLPYKDAAINSIGFLIGADESEYLENHVISAFTALETIASAISEYEGTAYILPEVVFQELRAELRKKIKSHLGSSVRADQRAALYAKLGELSRAPIVDRILELIQRFNIKWVDLWPTGADLGAELRQAYERRSILIHTGKIVDADSSQSDRLRVQILAERLLYKLFGGEEQWHGPFAYRHTSWLTHRSAPVGTPGAGAS